jgi:hypothetical protein
LYRSQEFPEQEVGLSSCVGHCRGPLDEYVEMAELTWGRDADVRAQGKTTKKKGKKKKKTGRCEK